jgi:hypothetical protein
MVSWSCQRCVNRDESLTDRLTRHGNGGRVTGAEYRVVVVRVWRDAERLVVRVLTGSDLSAPAREWVFTDVDAASDLVHSLLRELEQRHECGDAGGVVPDTSC